MLNQGIHLEGNFFRAMGHHRISNFCFWCRLGNTKIYWLLKVVMYKNHVLSLFLDHASSFWKWTVFQELKKWETLIQCHNGYLLYTTILDMGDEDAWSRVCIQIFNNEILGRPLGNSIYVYIGLTGISSCKMQ